MGMSRPSYGRGQGSFFGRRSPPMRNPRMPMPPMNQPQAPSGGGFLAQLGSSPMMQRPMPGGPGKGRGQMQQPMPFSPMMNRFNPALQRLTQGPMPLPPTNQRQAPSGGFFLGNMLNNAMSQGQIGQPQPPFMGRVGNNMPQEPRMTTFMPMRNMEYGMGFYGGGITDLY